MCIAPPLIYRKDYNSFFAVYSSVISVLIIPLRNAAIIASFLLSPLAIAMVSFALCKFSMDAQSLVWYKSKNLP